MPSHDDIQLVIRTLQMAGFDAATQRDETYSESLPLRLRNNPDGSFQWVWMAGAREAGYLRFSSAGPKKEKLGFWLIRSLFKWRGERWFADEKLELFMAPSVLNGLISKWSRDFAISIGVPGPNRRSMIWHPHGQRGIFIKLSPGGMSDVPVSKERKTLKQLQGMRSYFMRVPRVTGGSAEVLEMEDIRLRGIGAGVFSRQHDLALTELHIHTSTAMAIMRSSWWWKTQELLKHLKKREDRQEAMIRRLERLAASIDPQQVIICSCSNGNFTPWNMTFSGQKLRVYDWESSMPDAPALWDAFHFVFQSGIFIHRHPAATILQEANKLRNTMLAAWLQDPDGELFDGQLRLYLLTYITDRLHVYGRQSQWPQQEWQVLEEVLNELVVAGPLKKIA